MLHHLFGGISLENVGQHGVSKIDSSIVGMERKPLDRVWFDHMEDHTFLYHMVCTNYGRRGMKSFRWKGSFLGRPGVNSITLRIAKWACARKDFLDLKIDNIIHKSECLFKGGCLKE